MSRDFKAENRRAYVKHIYYDFVSENRVELLARDLNELLWKVAYGDGMEGNERERVVASLRCLADALEAEGRDFEKASILVPPSLR